MLSDKSKATIDALSREDLQHEINLDGRSRFQGEKFAYLQTRLSTLLSQEQASEKVAETIHRRQELLLKHISTWVAVVTSVVGLLFGGGWYQEYQKNKRSQGESNQRLIAEYVQPIATLLSDNEGIYKELTAEPYVEPTMGILESYLIKIQRDGVPKHALMKRRIDTLVSNNETILTLLTKYESQAKTEAFKTESAKFRSHAILYSDRWKSLLEVYASKANFPTDAVAFPTGFPEAAQAELAVRRKGGP